MESLAAFCVRTGRTELLLQWDAGKNLPLTPEAVSSGSGRKVWWRCGRGHEWQAAVFARRAGGGCPVCAGGAKRRAGSRAGAENMPDPGKISS